MMPMVTALDLDDLIAPGMRARQAQRIHSGLRARVAEAHLLNGREAAHQLFRQVHDIGTGQRIQAAFAKLITQSFYQHWMRMTDQQTAKSKMEVGIPVPIEVPNRTTLGPANK